MAGKTYIIRQNLPADFFSRFQLMKRLLIFLILLLIVFNGYTQVKLLYNSDVSTFKSWINNSQPIIDLNQKETLKNFHCAQNTFFWKNMKAVFDKNNNIIIAGMDDSKRKIHLQKRNLSSRSIQDYYVYNPFADSLDIIPNLTSFNITADSNKFLIVFEKKYLIYLEIKSNKLVITRKISFNDTNFPPYNEYYYYKELFGIQPVNGIIINKKPYYYEDILSVDILQDLSKKNIYSNKYVNPEFLNLGLSSYVNGKDDKLILANALKNEVILINLLNYKTDTLKNVIPSFTEINKFYFDSIYKKYRGRNIPSRLNEFLEHTDSFNYIFKIILKSENEIWVIWKGKDEKPKQIKLDIIVFDIKTKTWKTKYHRLVYDYFNMGQSEIVTETSYPIDFFNNLTYIKDNKLFVIANDNMDFDPIGKTLKEVKDLMKSNTKPKSLKLYEFEIKEQ